MKLPVRTATIPDSSCRGGASWFAHAHKSYLLCVERVFVGPDTLVRGTIEAHSLCPRGGGLPERLLQCLDVLVPWLHPRTSVRLGGHIQLPDSLLAWKP